MSKNELILRSIKNHPEKYSFFQMVRLLELANKKSSDDIGVENNPQNESVRFSAVNHVRFPVGEVEKIDVDANERLILHATFMGLTGPSGVLPAHYTEQMIHEESNKNESLRDYFDLFNHRAISLFYRAWAKSKYYIGYEKQQRENKQDVMTKLLQSLCGMSEYNTESCMPFNYKPSLSFVGHYAHHSRPLIAVKQMVESLFGVPARIVQFQGEWRNMGEKSKTRLPKNVRLSHEKNAFNNILGVNMTAGEKLWCSQHRFALILGPMKRFNFTSFFPNQKYLSMLCQYLRSYIGIELSFTIHLQLRTEDNAILHLTKEKPVYLGWNTNILNDGYNGLLTPVGLKEPHYEYH